MAPIQKKGNYFLLSINDELVTEAYLQRFLELLEFRALARKNQISSLEADSISEELKESWWNKNKEDFLKP